MFYDPIIRAAIYAGIIIVSWLVRNTTSRHKNGSHNRRIGSAREAQLPLKKYKRITEKPTNEGTKGNPLMSSIGVNILGKGGMEGEKLKPDQCRYPQSHFYIINVYNSPLFSFFVITKTSVSSL